MADQVPEDTFELTLAGRAMRFKMSSQGSLMALQRVLNRLRGQFREADDPAVLDALATRISMTVLDVAESRFVNPDDVAFVEEQMMLGKLDLPDIMRIFSNGHGQEEQVPDDAPPKKTAAKRTPKAAPVKRTANASRARR